MDREKAMLRLKEEELKKEYKKLFRLNEDYKDQIRDVKRTVLRIDRKIEQKRYEIDNMIDILDLDPALKHDREGI